MSTILSYNAGSTAISLSCSHCYSSDWFSFLHVFLFSFKGRTHGEHVTHRLYCLFLTPSLVFVLVSLVLEHVNQLIQCMLYCLFLVLSLMLVLVSLVFLPVSSSHSSLFLFLTQFFFSLSLILSVTHFRSSFSFAFKETLLEKMSTILQSDTCWGSAHLSLSLFLPFSIHLSLLFSGEHLQKRHPQFCDLIQVAVLISLSLSLSFLLLVMFLIFTSLSLFPS